MKRRIANFNPCGVLSPLVVVEKEEERTIEEKRGREIEDVYRKSSLRSDTMESVKRKLDFGEKESVSNSKNGQEREGGDEGVSDEYYVSEESESGDAEGEKSEKGEEDKISIFAKRAGGELSKKCEIEILIRAYECFEASQVSFLFLCYFVFFLVFF